ncbi:hypothetical protein [Streptomyces chartreusis]|uniref:Uncharacterized protein n=1 Tax=Streptomyces chartreusis NRRL 3882 TaxID=1079985 RepID=A0A2N9AZZ6_STRCX|nr:hypothetical protein SCNRRL3882_0125 [Streptomyces chartreusis NRRL 3882]
MTNLPSRRRLLATGAGTALSLGTLGTTASHASAAPASAASTKSANGSGSEESRTLDELYQDALTEGGDLANSGSGASVRTVFRARFPEIDLQLIVDYSKYHDVRIDNQFATGTLVPDVVQLQTLQDFTRGKREGRLLHYKPAGFSKPHKKSEPNTPAGLVGTRREIRPVQRVAKECPAAAHDLTKPPPGSCAAQIPPQRSANDRLSLLTRVITNPRWAVSARVGHQRR